MKIKNILVNAAKRYIAKIEDEILSRKNDSEKIIYDGNGNEYREHEVISGLTGIAKEKAFYRVSDENSEYTLLITVFFGIIGAHHLLRGNFKSALFYLLTFGGFGILYLSDVISICLGSYYYYEASYDLNDDEYRRYREKVYLRAFKGIRIKLMAIMAAAAIALISDVFLCFPLYRTLNKGISDLFYTGVNSYVSEIRR